MNKWVIDVPFTPMVSTLSRRFDGFLTRYTRCEFETPIRPINRVIGLLNRI